MKRAPLAFIASALILITVAQSANAGSALKPVLSLETARQIMAAAQEEAKRNNWPSVIAIVDVGGRPILLERMDDAILSGTDLAVGKARSAALFKKPTQVFEDAINHGRIAAVSAAASGYVLMQGGIPIVLEGNVVGAIGVSGENKDNDVQVAEAGLAALHR